MINILYFLFFLAISPAGADSAPRVSCKSSSLECCWVIRSWELMGQTTSVSSTNPTGCCKMGGVTCSGSNVTEINWAFKNLGGQIPIDILNLVNLQIL
jgi:hypothetical protein